MGTYHIEPKINMNDAQTFEEAAFGMKNFLHHAKAWGIPQAQLSIDVAKSGPKAGHIAITVHNSFDAVVDANIADGGIDHVTKA